MSLLSLFHPPKPYELREPQPTLVHTLDHGKMTGERLKSKQEKAATNLTQYLKRKSGT